MAKQILFWIYLQFDEVKLSLSHKKIHIATLNKDNKDNNSKKFNDWQLKFINTIKYVRIQVNAF
jgi:hypothetical protein